MHVKTDHQVVAHGDDTMRLYDGDGNTLATATRAGDRWSVTSDHGDAVADSRADAIATLTDHAFNVLGPSGGNGEGYSTLVPHGLAETP